ncbi:MAG: tRNA (adenosine(37)-N6)-threonylcarbamoyltransferase complex dimerization subunit type 1 TsaB [Steroidobacteraceae bacterium]
MKLLALDSATEACSAALLQDDGVSERFEIIGRGHAERLLPMADALLREAGIAIGEVDAIAFGRGPGSFTGLRIAAGIAQGLAAGARLPVVPISNLAAIAAAGARNSGATHILACLDARMGEVYWAAYEMRDGVPVALTDERLSKPDAVVPPHPGSWHGAGHGFGAYPALAERLGDRLEGVDATLLPRASDIARLGAVELAAGRTVAAPRALPVYLRNDVVHRR